MVTNSNAVSYIQQLPHDEKEAEQMLQEGTLDSSLWLAVQQFYVQPIRVPDGDLQLLKDIVPGLPNNLPTDSATLSRYKPWDKNSIKKFYKDYPKLHGYAPILRFKAATLPSSGKIGVSLKKKSYTNDVDSDLRFAYKFNSRYSLSTKSSFTKKHARWRYRRFVASWVPFSVTAGNFSEFSDKGMFTGYFPSVSESDTNSIDNWLYGSYRLWNGIRADLLQHRKRFLRGVYHTRPTETIVGAHTYFYPEKWFSGHGGIISITIRDTSKRVNDTMMYAYSGYGIGLENYEMELYGGVDLREKKLGLTITSATITRGSIDLEISLLHIPKGFSAPRSRQWRRFVHDFGADTAQAALSEMVIQVFHDLDDFFSYTTGISSRYSNTFCYFMEPMVKIELYKPLSLDFTYRYRAIDDGNVVNPHNYAKIHYDIDVHNVVSIDHYISISYKNTHGLRYRSLLSLISNLSYGSFCPFVTISGKRNELPEVGIGFEHALSFYPRTTMEWSIEKGISESVANGTKVRVYGLFIL